MALKQFEKAIGLTYRKVVLKMKHWAYQFKSKYYYINTARPNQTHRYMWGALKATPAEADTADIQRIEFNSTNVVDTTRYYRDATQPGNWTTDPPQVVVAAVRVTD